MILSANRYPSQSESEVPLVILHGLFGSAKNWTSLAKTLSADRDVIVLSLRNHGDSPHGEAMDYTTMAQDVRETLDHLATGSVDLLGHSMGGKVAMTLALSGCDAINRLIVVDMAPKTYRPRYGHYVEAMQAIPLAQIKRRSEADVYLQEVIADASLRAFVLQNLVIEDGVARWQVNLAAIGAGMGDIEDFPAVDGIFRKPTLFLRGETSSYIKDADLDTIRRLFIPVDVQMLKGAGHWLHAEQPKIFIDRLTQWLQEAP